MAMIAQIADAVAVAINAAPTGTWALPFTAERAYHVIYDMDELGTMRVNVVPAVTQREPLSRAEDVVSYQIAVRIAAHLADLKPATIDPYIQLAEEMAAYFSRWVIEPLEASVNGIEITPLFDPDALDQGTVFETVVIITFQRAEPATGPG